MPGRCALLPLGLVIRLAAHAGYWYAVVQDCPEGVQRPGPNMVLRYTRTPIMAGTAFAAAAAVLTLTGAA